VTSTLPAWVAAHPIAWGALAGLAAALFGFALFDPQLWIVVLGVIFGLANWFIWRPGGPAHGWRQRLLERFPPRAQLPGLQRERRAQRAEWDVKDLGRGGRSGQIEDDRDGLA